MMRGPAASTLLERVLTASAAAAGTPITIDATRADAWSSATFSGERHVIDLSAASGGRLDHWLGALPDGDLVLRGHVLADLSVIRIDRDPAVTRARLEALTVSAG